MRQPGNYSGISSSSRSTGNHSLPLARIRKVMKKSGDDVKMISGEAPIVFSRACELFIEELTRKSWMVAVQGKRRTLQRDDVVSAIVGTELFDFLVDSVVVSNNHRSQKKRRDCDAVRELKTEDSKGQRIDP